MKANEILTLARKHITTYLTDDTLPIVVAIADPKAIKIGISIQRNFPLTLIERSYGIPFGRFRSDAARLVSDPEELHGYKWSIETHEAVFGADAATEEHLKYGRHRRVPIELSTGVGNVLQNMRSLAYVDRTLYMVVGERPDHPPPYACLVEYSQDSGRPGEVGVELLLFNELGGCQKVDKRRYSREPVRATREAQPKFEDQIRWAVSGYPLVICANKVMVEMTTRNVSDFRHVWRLPKLQKSLVARLAKIAPDPVASRIEFYFGFDEIREKRNFVLATREEPVVLPMELAMTEEWLETMCSVCQISPKDLWKEFGGERNHTLKFDVRELAEDFIDTDYVLKQSRREVRQRGDFYVDRRRHEVVVRLLPAIYPHHIVGVLRNGKAVNISICGQSGRSGITIEGAKDLCAEAGLEDALIIDNGQDVFARIKGGDIISHEGRGRQTRLTAGLHFASLLDPGPRGGFEIVSDNVTVSGKRDGARGKSGGGKRRAGSAKARPKGGGARRSS